MECACVQILHAIFDRCSARLTRARSAGRVFLEIARSKAVLGLASQVPSVSSGPVAGRGSGRRMKRMSTSERCSHAGCSWIVDQLIAIRDLENQLVAAVVSGDTRNTLLRFRVAELDRWVDMLDRALDGFAPVVSENRSARAPLSGKPAGETKHCSPRGLAIVAASGRR
jgi:hypothetical protein